MDFLNTQSDVHVSDVHELGRDPDKVCLRRRQFLDRVLRWARTCAICRTIFPPIDLVCDECRDRLLAIVNRETGLHQGDYPFPVHSLWIWDDEQDPLLRPVLNSFKGGYAARFAKWAAEVLVQVRAPACMDRIGFLFPRSTKANAHDHAWLLAQSFAAMWPGRAQVFGLTQVTGDTGSQKTKGLVDRSRIRFGPVDREKISRVEAWIFIDDVITSGATAMAAFMASGEPHSFEVWTLACRPKLAGKSRL